jgi:hypothetical protein
MLSLENFDRWTSNIEVIFLAHGPEPGYDSLFKRIALVAQPSFEFGISLSRALKIQLRLCFAL